MPRYCFKRKYGYVNITDNAVYLTSTGNWTEIERISEKSVVSEKKNAWRKARIKLFLYPSLVVMAGIVLAEISHLNLLSIWLLTGVVGGIALFKYFSSDLGNVYKIPVDKIVDIQILDEVVTISFLDADRKPSLEEIFELEDEAKEKLLTLSSESSHF